MVDYVVKNVYVAITNNEPVMNIYAQWVRMIIWAWTCQSGEVYIDTGIALVTRCVNKTETDMGYNVLNILYLT